MPARKTPAVPSFDDYWAAQPHPNPYRFTLRGKPVEAGPYLPAFVMTSLQNAQEDPTTFTYDVAVKCLATLIGADRVDELVDEGASLEMLGALFANILTGIEAEQEKAAKAAKASAGSAA